MKTQTTRMPSAAELLAAVSGFMEKKLLPALETDDAAGQKFNTRVAINVLDIVRRELQQLPDASLVTGLQALLDESSDELETLLLGLAARIRNGDFADDDPALLAVLRRHAVHQLAADNPKYSSYLAAMEDSHSPPS